MTGRKAVVAEPEQLTAAQTQALRSDLLDLKTELEQLTVSLQPGARPVDLDLAIGRLSRMEAIQQQKMSEATLAQARQRLLQVGAALASFEDDMYGYCRRCEEPIGFARLNVRPESPCCLACQSQVEAKQ